MKLSILDQAPMINGQTPEKALHSAIKLAQLGDELGFQRYWIAEHHGFLGLTCSNPDVMLAAIGAQTKRIRIGAGAVLLPYYKPFRVAETYNLLATLYPNRVDLGIGRAPGGSAEVSMALSDNFLAAVNQFPALLMELSQLLANNHENSKLLATPLPKKSPQLWLLGTSEKSAFLASERKMHYAFGHFMTDFNGADIVDKYRDNFKVTEDESPYVIVAVSVICAVTNELANRIAQSVLVWQLEQTKINGMQVIPRLDEVEKMHSTIEEEEKISRYRDKMVIGDPNRVKQELLQIKKLYKADELMIITITGDESDKFTSYRLLAETLL